VGGLLNGHLPTGCYVGVLLISHLPRCDALRVAVPVIIGCLGFTMVHSHRVRFSERGGYFTYRFGFASIPLAAGKRTCACRTSGIRGCVGHTPTPGLGTVSQVVMPSHRSRRYRGVEVKVEVETAGVSRQLSSSKPKCDAIPPKSAV